MATINPLILINHKLLFKISKINPQLNQFNCFIWYQLKPKYNKRRQGRRGDAGDVDISCSQILLCKWAAVELCGSADKQTLRAYNITQTHPHVYIFQFFHKKVEKLNNPGLGNQHLPMQQQSPTCCHLLAQDGQLGRKIKLPLTRRDVNGALVTCRFRLHGHVTGIGLQLRVLFPSTSNSSPAKIHIFSYLHDRIVIGNI